VKYLSIGKERDRIKACMRTVAIAMLTLGMLGLGNHAYAESGTSAGQTSGMEKDTHSNKGGNKGEKGPDRTIGGSPKGTEKSLGSSRSEDPTGRAPAGTYNAPGGSGGDKGFSNVRGDKGGSASQNRMGTDK
jgi:hypothetical protein